MGASGSFPDAGRRWFFGGRMVAPTGAKPSRASSGCTTTVLDRMHACATPVTAGDVAYGMLTLDALEPGSLSADGARLLRLMAGALAVALSIT